MISSSIIQLHWRVFLSITCLIASSEFKGLVTLMERKWNQMLKDWKKRVIWTNFCLSLKGKTPLKVLNATCQACCCLTAVIMQFLTYITHDSCFSWGVTLTICGTRTSSSSNSLSVSVYSEVGLTQRLICPSIVGKKCDQMVDATNMKI